MRHVTITRGAEVKTIEVSSVEAWGAVASDLACTLHSGDILALSGELGAGKTTFVQALARALGISRSLQSPTFSLLRSYPLPKTVNGIQRLLHVDAYRLQDERELIVLDLDEELADGNSILVVEWPENIATWIRHQAGKVTHVTIDTR